MCAFATAIRWGTRTTRFISLTSNRRASRLAGGVGVRLRAPAERHAGSDPARAEIDYRVPAKYGDVLEFRIGLEKIGRTSFTYAYEMVDQRGQTSRTREASR